ncbi:MAG: chitosanase [Alphaproteobacteria bacterium]|nr:chitosanase [Alphaproteobacteria bacterium]
MITDLQKRTVQAIVNIFETGKILGEYGQVTLLTGDTGHLTYGRSQTTLASGNLYLLIKAYCEAPGAALQEAMAPYLNRLDDRDLSLDHDMPFRNLLRDAGDDPVMHDEQDAFFDRIYWEPAIRSAEYIHSTTALGMAVVYDSRIHGSWHHLRDRTNENFGTLADKGEQGWMKAYIATRRDWLSNHSNALLGKTVYRMDALDALCDTGEWTLELPIRVRGNRIDEAALTSPVVRVSAEDPEPPRTLRLRDPVMEGDDVRVLQETLNARGKNLGTDGIFGPGTDRAVKDFQESEDLTPDGIVGPATRSRLGLDD